MTMMGEYLGRRFVLGTAFCKQKDNAWPFWDVYGKDENDNNVWLKTFDKEEVARNFVARLNA